MRRRPLPVLLLLLLAAQSPPAAVTVEQRVVQVDGVPMALHVSGTGGPVIVLEAGSGSDHRSWARLQPALSAFARVVSYDRLDYGQSGRSARPRTAAVIAEQLRAGLRAGGLEPPYLLVGHSYGGPLVRVFASLYPAETLGLVLIDPAQEDFYLRAAVAAPRAYLAQLEQDLAQDEARASDALRREYLAYETSMMQARLAAPPPGNRIVLLSARRNELPDDLRSIWLAEQARWAARVGARRVEVDSGHNIMRQAPAAVMEAVRSLLPAQTGAGNAGPGRNFR